MRLKESFTKKEKERFVRKRNEFDTRLINLISDINALDKKFKDLTNRLNFQQDKNKIIASKKDLESSKKKLEAFLDYIFDFKKLHYIKELNTFKI